MFTALGILLFASALAVATMARVVLFARDAAARGWVVQRSVAGIVLTRSAEDGLPCKVTLPLLVGERRAAQRWCVRIDGALPGVPAGGLAIHHPGRGPNVRIASGLRKVAALEPGGAVARAQDEAAARTLAADADVVAALERAFARDSQVVEIACTPGALEVRARRDRWSYDELDEVCARAIELAEAFEAPS